MCIGKWVVLILHANERDSIELDQNRGFKKISIKFFYTQFSAIPIVKSWIQILGMEASKNC